jgi:hypothetical protein
MVRPYRPRAVDISSGVGDPLHVHSRQVRFVRCVHRHARVGLLLPLDASNNNDPFGELELTVQIYQSLRQIFTTGLFICMGVLRN